jgi:hypothetical protein
MADDPGLPLPSVRCLTKEQAAAYLGIGVTLLLQLGPPPIKFGRRSVWDVVDLDRWLEDYKGRGRTGKALERMACAIGFDHSQSDHSVSFLTELLKPA